MGDLDFETISPIRSKSREDYYDKNALKAYKGDIKSYNGESRYNYGIINGFLQVNNVNSKGVNLINIKHNKLNKERVKNIIEIVKGIDRIMLPYNSKKQKVYKGITHISKRTLDTKTPVIYKSYNSITTDYKTALSFATTEEGDEYRIVLELTIHPQIKAYDYSDEYNESEILLERNTVLSNFEYKERDIKNRVYIYTALVSKYNPEPLFIPPKSSPKLLDLRIDKNTSPKKIKLFDIMRNNGKKGL